MDKPFDDPPVGIQSLQASLSGADPEAALGILQKGGDISWAKTRFNLGIVPETGAGGDLTLMTLALAGIPLSAIPLSAIPLSAIPLSAIPLSAIPLSAIYWESTPLSAWV